MNNKTNIMKKAPFYLVLFLIVFSSCKKYDEGPAISLRSKEKRLCQEWEMKKIELNGTIDADEDFSYYYWDIHKEGTIDARLKYTDESDEETKEFKWEWINDKKGIKITDQNGKKESSPYFHKLFKSNSSVKDDGAIDFEIKRLTYNELILEFEESSDKYRIEFGK